MNRSATLPLRVLVTDDCPDTRRTLDLMLKLWGHEVRTAGDGPAALHLAEDFRPDVVLLDIVLPGMGGCEVARRLRQELASCRPWLVALTGQVAPGDVADALEADFDHYLAKPCAPEHLHQLLHACALQRGRDCSRCPPDRLETTETQEKQADFPRSPLLAFSGGARYPEQELLTAVPGKPP